RAGDAPGRERGLLHRDRSRGLPGAQGRRLPRRPRGGRQRGALCRGIGARPVGAVARGAAQVLGLDRQGRVPGADARRLRRFALAPGGHSARAGAGRGASRARGARALTPPMERIGKYEIKRKLGEGATSEVYLCHDPFGNRDVAVKVVYEERIKGSSDPAKLSKKLFVAEASLAGKLKHPHI